jgi:O-antigen ligase
MTAQVTSTELMPQRELGPSPAAASPAHQADAWPHTIRALPWLLAGFIAMLWLIPFQDVALPVSLPVDAKLDRFALAGLALVWLAALLARGPDAPHPRRSAVNVAVGSFVVLAAASVLLNVQALANVDDLTIAIKKFALLGAYVIFFYIASTSLRQVEVSAFCGLIVGLACVTALLTIWEYRTGTNLFYDITERLMPPGFSLGAATGDEKFGRPAVTGPTQHGLAVATMLAFAFPFALIGVIRSRGRRKLAYALASAVILAGAAATLRKSAVVVPAAAVVVLFAYRPRALIRLAPLGLVLLMLANALSPGALGSLRGQLRPDRVGGSTSTLGRTQDYTAVAPDVKAHLATGRGYGSYDSHKYRLLDNQYLALLIETGVLGVAAYVAMMLAILLTAHRIIRSGDSSRAPPALAIAGAAAAFIVCNALFDVLAFAQVPYLFFLLAALVVVLAQGAPREVTVRRSA